MLTFDAIGETVFCGTSGDGKAFHMNRLMNFYPQGGMKSVLSLQIENQQIQPLLETINSTDEIYLVDQKGYILAASEPEMAGLPIRTRMPEEDLEQKAQIEFERDGISKIGNIQSGVVGTKILVISDKETVLKDAKAVSRRMMFLILCSAAMVFLCIICYTRWLSTRVQKVVYAAKRMGQGEFDYRLENMGEDEIGQIGLAFNQLSDQIQELIRENYEKKIRIQTSELNLLQEQINPHFLYNALAVISALAMREGGKQTMQAVKNLSSFYRISLNKGKQVLSKDFDMDYSRISFLDNNEICVTSDVECRIYSLYGVERFRYTFDRKLYRVMSGATQMNYTFILDGTTEKVRLK